MTRLLIRALSTLFITTILFCALYLPSQPFFEKESRQTLQLFVWGGFIDPEVIGAFEQKNNVRIRQHFFSSNEELLSKLNRKGKSHYDIIFPSDYAVPLLKESGHIKPLNKEKLSFKERISPYLLNRSFDPSNEYSIPYSWEVYGIAINQGVFSSPIEPSLTPLFNFQSPLLKIVMTPDPVEAITLASHYLYGPNKALTGKEVLEIRSLLKNQKRITEAYADYRAKYLIVTNHAPIALFKTSFVCQLAKERPDIEFKLPKEGLFTSIENVVLSASCQNEELSYAFINYLYEPEVMAKNTEYSPLYPACTDSLKHTTSLEPIFFKTLQEIEQRQDFYFFYYILPPDTIREIWVHAKT